MALATLSIDLVAQLARLEEGMDKAGRLAAKNAAQIEKSYAGLRSAATQLGAVLGGAFSVDAMVTFFRTTVDGLDRLNDLKDATGASVEKISALEDVALRTGTSFESMSGSLVKLNAVLNEAKAGSETANTIKAIGLSVDDLKASDPAEALRKVAVALSGFADDGNKARIVAALFGKSVQEVAPFLKELAERGELVGKVTQQQADEAERLNKELAELSKNSLDFGRSIVSAVVPGLNEFIAKTKEAEGAAGRLKVFLKATGFGSGLKLVGIDVFGKDDSEKAAEYAKRIEAINALLSHSIVQGSQRARLERELLDLQLKSADAQRGALSQGFERTAASFGGSKPSAPDVPDATKKGPKTKKSEFVGPELPDSLKQAIDAINDTDLAASKRATAAIQELNTIFGAGAISAVEYAQALERIRGKDVVGPLLPPEEVERVKRLNELLGATPTAQLEETRKEMNLLADAFKRGEITAVQFSEAAQTRLGTLPEVLKPALTEMEVFANQAARNIQDALGDTIYDTLGGKFEGIGDMWANMLRRMVAEATAAQIGKSLLGDFAKTGNVGGALGDLFSSFGSFFGGGRAAGGPVQAGRFYEVNENGGPGELLEVQGKQYLMAARNGRVNPNRGGASSSSGGGAVINFSPTYQIDGSTDPARLYQIATDVAAESQRALMEQLEASRRI
jgi:hypothetical protein